MRWEGADLGVCREERGGGWLDGGLEGEREEWGGGWVGGRSPVVGSPSKIPPAHFFLRACLGSWHSVYTLSSLLTRAPPQG